MRAVALATFLVSFGRIGSQPYRSEGTFDDVSGSQVLPVGLGARGRRQRRSLAQQAAQRRLEVALRQTVQVELWQQLTHFLGAPGEQRQYRTLKSLFQTPHPRAFNLDRARG